QLGIYLKRRRRSSRENVLAQGFSIFTIESLLVRRHLVKHCAQAKEIGAAIDIFATHLLRRHVVQNRRNSGYLTGKLSQAGNAVSQNSDRAIPSAHDLGGVKAMVKNVVRAGVFKAAAHLPADIEQVPDRETLFAGKHGSYAIALNVFHG